MANKQDHPRVGGEKTEQDLRLEADKGSPPRGRGKEKLDNPFPKSDRITPAWAGKSAGERQRPPCPQDHPRVGGEKTSFPITSVVGGGSPPRGRGKVFQLFQLEILFGITPAWAGKRLKRFHRSGIFISGPIPFHSVLHRPAGSGGSRAGRDGAPAGQPQNAGPA